MSAHPPAGWHPDPLGRFDHRYWDGEVWTEHVSRAGQQLTDPLTPTTGGDAHEQLASDADADRAWADTGPVTRTTNAKAVASLALSILWVMGLTSIAAIILGVLAKRELRDHGDQQTGDGLATAGIVIGAIGVLGAILIVVASVMFFTMPVRVG